MTRNIEFSRKQRRIFNCYIKDHKFLIMKQIFDKTLLFFNVVNRIIQTLTWHCTDDQLKYLKDLILKCMQYKHDFIHTYKINSQKAFELVGSFVHNYMQRWQFVDEAIYFQLKQLQDHFLLNVTDLVHKKTFSFVKDQIAPHKVESTVLLILKYAW